MTPDGSTSGIGGLQGAVAPFRPALVLVLPIGTLIGSGVGALVGVAALLAGAGWTALYFVGSGALVGLAAAAVAAAGGLVTVLVVHRSRFAASVRGFAVVAAGFAVLLATFLFGVVGLGYGRQAGGAYLWGVAATVLAAVTWICAGLLTSSQASALLPRRVKQPRSRVR